MARKKISILGAGRVGSIVCQICAYKELGDIVLWNRTGDKAKGLALDISESLPIEGKDTNVIGTGNLKDTKKSDVVCLTVGGQRKEGQSRDELLVSNAEMVRDLAKEAARYSPKCVMMVLTNPLDAMTYLAWKASGLPKERVVGMAGILDSSRFASFLANELKVSVKDVRTLVLGGHGDFMVPLPAYTYISGVPLTNMMSKEKIDNIVKRTRNAGAEIISLEKDSSAFFAPGSALVQMIESVIRDEKRILSCTAYLDGQFGVKGIFMGVPVKLGAGGVEEIVELKLSADEKKAFADSVRSVKLLVSKLKI
jgi:malate dehydrogenase